MEIGDRIKYLRTLHGLTLEQVGLSVGVGKSTVRKWEVGEIANMRRDKIASLAKALHTSPAYLMGWTDDPNAVMPSTSTEQEQTPPALSGDEIALIEKYRALDERGRAAVEDTLNRELKYICEKYNSIASDLTQTTQGAFPCPTYKK